jgi:WW domain
MHEQAFTKDPYLPALQWPLVLSNDMEPVWCCAWQGWEARVDATTGRTFYVDHNSRRTTWERPVHARSTGPLSTAGGAGIRAVHSAADLGGGGDSGAQNAAGQRPGAGYPSEPVVWS